MGDVIVAHFEAVSPGCWIETDVDVPVYVIAPDQVKAVGRFTEAAADGVATLREPAEDRAGRVVQEAPCGFDFTTRIPRIAKKVDHASNSSEVALAMAERVGLRSGPTRRTPRPCECSNLKWG